MNTQSLIASARKGEPAPDGFLEYVAEQFEERGCVYFLGAGDGSRVKIGWSRNITRRLVALQTGAHQTLTVLHASPGGMSLERALHRVLASRRLRGEWFDNSDGFLVEVADGVFMEFMGEACRHLRRKGEECIAEAERLDELYLAVTEASAA